MRIGSLLAVNHKLPPAEGRTQPGPTSPHADGDPSRLIDFLRRLHPIKTAESVAAKAGVCRETVKKWLAGSSRPSLTAGVKIFKAYGPEALACLFKTPPSWLSRAAVETTLHKAKDDLQRLMKRIDDIEKGL